ncbi:MAG: NAD(P)-dependent oxidoreductase [Euryarchaeota archaeon]|nr:NAD(P)-dependent oxidoreductase [Euryarchaeota archaeon]
MATPRVLVTGACGFVGQNLVELLRGEGLPVRATDLPTSDPAHVKELGAEFIPADLLDKKSLRPLVEDVEIVFHPASLFDYSATYEQLHRVNVGGMQNLCEAAMDSGVKRFIHWSTEGVYGLPKTVPVTEDHPKDPVNPYNKTKWLQEQYAWKLHREQGFPLTVIRPAPMYGPWSRYGMATVGNIVMKGQLPFVAYNLRNHRAPAVYVTDVARAARFLSRKPEAIGEPYNVVDDALYTIYDLLLDAAQFAGGRIYKVNLSHRFMVRFMNRLARRLDKRGRKIGARPPIEPNTIEYMDGNFWFSNQKLKKLGFQLLYPDTKIGLRIAYQWYLENGWA